MLIYIKSSEESIDQFELEVDPYLPIEELKSIINKKIDIPIERYRLIFAG